MNFFSKHIIKVIARMRFPKDPKKQSEFVQKTGGVEEIALDPFEIINIPDVIAARTLWLRLERIEAHAKMILETRDDPRHDIVKKIPPMINDAIRRIECGLGCGFQVAQIEKLCEQADMVFIGPLADAAVKTKRQRSDGGRNSHGLTDEERKQRNAHIQEEINRLCKKISYTEACRRVARQFRLSFTTVRNSTQNPTVR